MRRIAPAPPTLQVLLLRLGGEEFGLDVHAVHEVVRADGLRGAASAPDFAAGVVELRGERIPVVDLRRRFAAAPEGDGGAERLVVAALGAGRVALLVDAVTEVLAVPEDALALPPELFRGRASRYIRAVARVEERLIILIDLESLFTPEEWSALEAAERWTDEGASSA